MVITKVKNGKRTNQQSAGLIRGLLVAVIILSLLGIQPPGYVHAQDSITFAVITDFGNCSTLQQNVANMVNGWNDIEFIVTAGDNHHGTSSGCAMGDYKRAVGYYYGTWVRDQKFWPVLGNHDYDESGGFKNLPEYFKYFHYLNGSYYYDLRKGPVHFFMIDSGPIGSASDVGAAVQQAWLEGALASSDAPWKIVVTHISPYTGGFHSYDTSMRWAYAEWGANFVISGHNHIYERIHRQEGPNNDIDIVYFTSGVAGGIERNGSHISGLEAYHYNSSGAMKVNANDESITFQYITTTNGTTQTVRDTYTQHKPKITTNSTMTKFTSHPGEYSDQQSYTVSGVNLKGDITITPPENFRIRLASGGDWIGNPNTLVLNGTSGTVTSTEILVRFVPLKAGVFSGNIIHASPAATSSNVPVSGLAKEIITVTAGAGQSKVYGHDDPVFTFTYSPDVPEVAFTGALSRVQGEDVGAYAITIGSLSAVGHPIEFVPADFEIKRKAAFITPHGKSKVYGEADPTLTGILSGFLEADSVTAAYSRTAGETAVGSPYTISATLSPAGVLGNYIITYNTADFTIAARPVTVAADNLEKEAGEEDPSLSYQINSGSLAFTDMFAGKLEREPGEDVGLYAVLRGTLAIDDGNNGDNYSLSFEEGTFKIIRTDFFIYLPFIRNQR
jgi:hypothetical protein